MTKEEHRAVKHLRNATRDHPQCWKHFDMFRQDREELGGWPEWCFCPMAGAYAVASQGGHLDFDQIGEVARLAALAAWRPTQGIYRFDNDLLDALIKAPPKGALPCDLLYRLPVWCVYIELPYPDFHGFFAHLEWDANHERAELRFLLDFDDRFAPLPLHLGHWDIGVALDEMAREARTNAVAQNRPAIGSPAELAPLASRLTSLVLYLCSEQADYQRPPPPRSKGGKDKERIIPPSNARQWSVGTRIGAAIRKGRADSTIEPSSDNDNETGQNQARPRPHIRAAHWHLYWTGPKTGDIPQKPRVRWVPPTGVNLDLGDTIATIRPVRSPN